MPFCWSALLPLPYLHVIFERTKTLGLLFRPQLCLHSRPNAKVIRLDGVEGKLGEWCWWGGASGGASRYPMRALSLALPPGPPPALFAPSSGWNMCAHDVVVCVRDGEARQSGRRGGGARTGGRRGREMAGWPLVGTSRAARPAAASAAHFVGGAALYTLEPPLGVVFWWWAAWLWSRCREGEGRGGVSVVVAPWIDFARAPAGLVSPSLRAPTGCPRAERDAQALA